jgi:hypothetical protein
MLAMILGESGIDCPLVVITTNGRFVEVLKTICGNAFVEIRKKNSTMKETFR